MKIYGLLFAGVLLLSVQSCSKNNSDDQPQPVFSWTMDGGVTQISDTTSFLPLFGTYTLYGKKGTTNLFISTNSTNTGSYSSISATAGAGLTIAGTQYGNTGVTITIQSNADRRLAGSFHAVMINGTVDTIDLAGSFSNIRY